MPSTGNVKRLFDALRSYLKNLRGTTETQVTSKNLEALSIAYSTIPLPRPTKWVRIYFTRKATNAYGKHLYVWDLYEAQVLNDRSSAEVIKQLSDYVMSWHQEKYFGADSREFIEKLVVGLGVRCTFHLNRMRSTWEWFEKANAEEDNLTDWFDAKFKEPVTEFPYVRAYNYFFRKKRIDVERVRSLIDADIAALDELVNMLQLLDSGWDKCGKGDAFDDFRETQQLLLKCVRLAADAIEYEIHLYEYVLKFNQTPITFKVFPMD